MQEKIVRARSKLKGTRIVIHEDLCRELQLVLNRLNKYERVKLSWSWRGKIYMSDQRNRKREVHCGESLDKLLKEFPKPPGGDHAQLEVNGVDLA